VASDEIETRKLPPIAEKILAIYYFKTVGFPSWAGDEYAFFSWLFGVEQEEIHNIFQLLEQYGLMSKSED